MSEFKQRIMSFDSVTYERFQELKKTFDMDNNRMFRLIIIFSYANLDKIQNVKLSDYFDIIRAKPQHFVKISAPNSYWDKLEQINQFVLLTPKVTFRLLVNIIYKNKDRILHAIEEV